MERLNHWLKQAESPTKYKIKKIKMVQNALLAECLLTIRRQVQFPIFPQFLKMCMRSGTEPTKPRENNLKLIH